MATKFKKFFKVSLAVLIVSFIANVSTWYFFKTYYFDAKNQAQIILSEKYTKQGVEPNIVEEWNLERKIFEEKPFAVLIEKSLKPISVIFTISSVIVFLYISIFLFLFFKNKVDRARIEQRIGFVISVPSVAGVIYYVFIFLNYGSYSIKSSDENILYVSLSFLAIGLIFSAGLPSKIIKWIRHGSS